MAPSLTDTLCTQCGLCCDGSLFADVELAGEDEADGLEILGLNVEEDGDDFAVLQQPCAALEGRRCTVYEHRPACCRTFECRLLYDVRRGAVTIGDAQARIASTLEQIARVERLLGPARAGEERLPLKERCADALSGTGVATPRARATLSAAMAAVEQSIRRAFLREA